MSHHADSDGSLKSPRIWCTEDFRALDAVRVRKSEVVYAFVSLGGKPSFMDEAVLDAMERERARRFMRRTDCHRFVLAHAALRLFLARCLDVDPVTVCYEKGPHGKPRLGTGLVPLEFNLSHSEMLGLLAVAQDRPVGVDVERIREVPDVLGIADAHFSAVERRRLRSLPPAERRAAFIRCWTRKEAVLKASGEGLGLRLDSFDVELAEGSTSALERFAGRPGNLAEWSLRDLPSPPGYAAAGAIAAIVSAPTQWRSLSAGVPGKHCGGN